ncbi:MAG: methyltransferase [Devosia sp.]|uniref:class I SAM-dependent methyltransferase n=1 Tax=Devosia sp. TaxID=1871048 RepID=UPI001AD1F96A|nr:methyltransferase [Devosia sp.]
MSPAAPAASPAEFIRTNLRLEPARGFPHIRLYTPHPGSGLRRLEDETRAAPYWAYVWSGGAALARHISEHPSTVTGRTVLDLGSGCGIVAITAAQAGATTAFATDLDRYALAATALNAAANEVDVAILPGLDPLPRVDLVLAGDVFYDASAARQSALLLDRFRGAGIPVLVGDPGRKHLPLPRMTLLASYHVPEFGGATVPAAVYAWRP